MTVFYCDDGGSNTAPYDTWAKAATTLVTAVGAIAAGDDIYIGADHTEDPAASETYAFPGTAAAPNRVISVTVGTTTYNKADVIQINQTGTTHDIAITGHVKFYGLSILCGDDLFTTGTPSQILFDDCVIELNRVNNAVWQFGSANGQNIIKLHNTDINISGGGTGSSLQPISTCIFEWNGGIMSHSGTQPTALFDGIDRTVFISVAGVDLSSITSALIDVSSASDIQAEFHHCLLNASVSLTTGTISSVGTKILMAGCDDTTGNDLYRFEYVDYYGSIVHDDAIYRGSGASDGSNNISWKMVTTANAKEFSEPLVSPPIMAWIASTGSKTFTVHINREGADLDDDEIWLEVEYLSASADTESDLANDGLADILATPAAQSNSTEAWTGLGSPQNEQRLDVTVTVNRVGPVIARVHLAKPSATVYVDPKVEAA